jgi:hypothetical protein
MDQQWKEVVIRIDIDIDIIITITINIVASLSSLLPSFQSIELAIPCSSVPSSAGPVASTGHSTSAQAVLCRVQDKSSLQVPYQVAIIAVIGRTE